MDAIMFITQLLLRPQSTACVTRSDKLVTAHSWISDSLKIKGIVPKRYLWCLRPNQNTYQLTLISRIMPNKLVLGRYGVLSTITTNKYQVDLQLKQPYQFSLIANPTKRDRQTHKIKQITTLSQQEQWLLRKSAANGFQVDQVQVTPLKDGILLHNAQQPAKIARVSYTGQLTITNQEQFLQALLKGLGREKAYGLGLLLVKPLSLSG